MPKKGLINHGFKVLQVDPCMFIDANNLIYVDDFIVIRPESDEIVKFIQFLGICPEKFEFTGEGSL